MESNGKPAWKDLDPHKNLVNSAMRKSNLCCNVINRNSSVFLHNGLDLGDVLRCPNCLLGKLSSSTFNVLSPFSEFFVKFEDIDFSEGLVPISLDR